jgi:predicted regulator of amino acid metabolism with ACT domain
MITLIFITRKSIKYEDEDVWLNTEALAAIFNVDRSGIVRQINNIYKDDGLKKITHVQKLHIWVMMGSKIIKLSIII